MCEVVRRCVKKLCGKGGGLGLGEGNQISGETVEPVNLMEIIKGMVVTREVAGEEDQIQGQNYA